METIEIRSGLNDFLLLDRILDCGDNKLKAEKYFSSPEQYLLLESCAQAAAFHVRYLCDFDRHAFLLKIKYFQGLTVPGSLFLVEERESLTGNSLDNDSDVQGRVGISAQMISCSQSTFAYHVHAWQGEEVLVRGELLIGTTEYNQDLPEDRLRPYYREAFACLLSG